MSRFYYDQRGHGRSDYGTPEFWNLQTWADDLRRLYDTLGLVKPVLASTTGDAPITSAVPRYPAGWAATKQPPSPSAISPIRPKNPG